MSLSCPINHSKHYRNRLKMCPICKGTNKVKSENEAMEMLSIVDPYHQFTEMDYRKELGYVL